MDWREDGAGDDVVGHELAYEYGFAPSATLAFEHRPSVFVRLDHGWFTASGALGYGTRSESFEGWSYRLLVRACLHTVKRERRPTIVMGDRVVADDGLNLEADVADRDLILRGMRRLTARERSVLVLRYYLDLSVPQMADALHVPVGTAKSRLHHAERAMRAALDADRRSVEVEGELA